MASEGRCQELSVLTDAWGAAVKRVQQRFVCSRPANPGPSTAAPGEMLRGDF